MYLTHPLSTSYRQYLDALSYLNRDVASIITQYCPIILQSDNPIIESNINVYEDVTEILFIHKFVINYNYESPFSKFNNLHSICGTLYLKNYKGLFSNVRVLNCMPVLIFETPNSNLMLLFIENNPIEVYMKNCLEPWDTLRYSI